MTGMVCGDNRFKLIEEYKNKLIESTNIETAKDEMAVIDSILFRFWQMGWLDKLENFDRHKAEIERLKKTVVDLNSNITDLIFQKDKIKSEAIKEFAERLKSYLLLPTVKEMSVVTAEDIDNLVKIMVGDNNGKTRRA